MIIEDIVWSLTGREASTATTPLHPTNQRCWFHASHQSAHFAGMFCISPYVALYDIGSTDSKIMKK